MFRARRARRDDQRFIAEGSIGSALTRECLVVLRDRLESVWPGWRLGGPGLIGPNGLGVHVGEHESGPAAHPEIVFLLDHADAGSGAIRDRSVPTVKHTVHVTDAVAAVNYWFQTTAPVIFELFERHGRYATHYHGTDPDGLAGWHVIHGPIQGWGVGHHSDGLVSWTVDHPLLPPLSGPLLAALGERWLVSVRIFFGGHGVDDVAEVRIDGEVDDNASRALYDAPWPRPRPDDVGYVKVFVLAIHRDKA